MEILPARRGQPPRFRLRGLLDGGPGLDAVFEKAETTRHSRLVDRQTGGYDDSEKSANNHTYDTTHCKERNRDHAQNHADSTHHAEGVCEGQRGDSDGQGKQQQQQTTTYQGKHHVHRPGNTAEVDICLCGDTITAPINTVAYALGWSWKGKGKKQIRKTRKVHPNYHFTHERALPAALLRVLGSPWPARRCAQGRG